jgi:ABC-type nickel/cobalt efflux system permease component RcnA
MREGIYSIILLLVNVAILLLFAYYAAKNEIPLDVMSVAIIIGFITIMNWVTVWHTYEHFMYDYRNLARKRWIFEKITKIPVIIRGY